MREHCRGNAFRAGDLGRHSNGFSTTNIGIAPSEDMARLHKRNISTARRKVRQQAIGQTRWNYLVNNPRDAVDLMNIDNPNRVAGIDDYFDFIKQHPDAHAIIDDIAGLVSQFSAAGAIAGNITSKSKRSNKARCRRSHTGQG